MHDLSLVMSKGERFESARRLSFLSGLHVKPIGGVGDEVHLQARPTLRPASLTSSEASSTPCRPSGYAGAWIPESQPVSPTPRGRSARPSSPSRRQLAAGGPQRHPTPPSAQRRR